MVDKQEELLKFVRHKIWEIIFQNSFPELIYKEIKRKYFFEQLNKKIGIPRDSEVASVAMDHLFKIRYFTNKEHLEKILQLPFFSSNISNPEYYVQKYEMMDAKPELDLNLLSDKEYEASKIDEFTQHVINERTSDIDRGIKERLEAYESISSKLESENEIPEPEAESIEEDLSVQLDPWWKRLDLREDPFPNTPGLGNIDDSLYERIIVKTTIYERYVHYIDNIPKELFKNIIFYGQYGSGKTTLFEYLRVPLIKAHIDPMIITLPAEQDYQNFVMNFKKALCRELVKIYEKLESQSISINLQSPSLDDQVIECFRLVRSTGKNSGFVVFIDDIYKPPAYEKIALMFVNQLQTFKTQLIQQLGLYDIGFFISAPNEWRSIINGSQEYSGSISLEEEMPIPTVEEAKLMFNERLAAFSNNDRKLLEVPPQFALQVYKTLLLKKAWTFRQFINECVFSLRGGNLEMLTSNLVSINIDTLKNIKQILDRNPKLNEGINEILGLNISSRNKMQSLGLLVQIFNQKGFNEESELYPQKKFYLDILRRSGLIIKKSGTDNNAIWVASKEVSVFEKIVFDKYSLGLDDYFLKLLADKLEVEKLSPDFSNERYFISIEDLIQRIRNKNNPSLNSVQSHLEIALGLQKQIVPDVGKVSSSLSFGKFAEKCQDSIRSLSHAVLSFAGISMQTIASGNILDFWNDFWFYPDSLGVFLKSVITQPEFMEQDKTYLFSHYDTAFKDIVGFLSNQLKRSEIFPIPINGLKNSEIKVFNDARESNSEGNRAKAVEDVSRLVESKLREFLYSVFILQYGERSHRIQRLPIDLHSVIEKHEKSDKSRGFGFSNNELTNLTRENYCGIMVGQHHYNDIGTENWYRTFSKIFLSWDMVTMKSYFKKFADYNVRSVHIKQDAFIPAIQSDINQFIMNSITLLIWINQSYSNFLQRVKKIPRSGSSEMEYYFPLDDKISFLQSVRVSETNRQRFIQTLKLSKTNAIDLSSPCDIEGRYGINYQEVFAILSDLSSINSQAAEFKAMMRDPILILRTK